MYQKLKHLNQDAWTIEHFFLFYVFTLINILQFHSVNRFLVAEFMYRYERRLLPQEFHDYFSRSHHIHAQDHMISFAVNAPSQKTRFSNIKWIGSTTWNALPNNIRCLSILQLFRWELLILTCILFHYFCKLTCCFTRIIKRVMHKFAYINLSMR